MANEEVLGPRKTMFVLVIVVGCFAVLWPRILSPLILGPNRDQLKSNQFDREAGCCEVIFETEVAVLELLNEVCSSAVHVNGKLSPYEVAECRKAVNETCGLDIVALLKRSDNVGKTSKMLVETMKNSNSSCLKEHFGVPVWSLGSHLVQNAWIQPDTVKQERPTIRGAGPHPAMRERGRAIPAGAPSPARGPVAMPPNARVRTSPLSVYFELDIKPPPIPGMRPPLGSPGGPVPAPKSSMGFVMPIYTICIIVFFVYTLSKILFKRTGTVPYEAVTPDPQFRRRVFRDDSRTSPEKLVVTAISGLVAEVQQQMEANYAQNQQRQDVQDNHPRPYTNGTILHNSGPVHIVTSEYREPSKEKSPEPTFEKEPFQVPEEQTKTPETVEKSEGIATEELIELGVESDLKISGPIQSEVEIGEENKQEVTEPDSKANETEIPEKQDVKEPESEPKEIAPEVIAELEAAVEEEPAKSTVESKETKEPVQKPIDPVEEEEKLKVIDKEEPKELEKDLEGIEKAESKEIEKDLGEIKKEELKEIEKYLEEDVKELTPESNESTPVEEEVAIDDSKDNIDEELIQLESSADEKEPSPEREIVDAINKEELFMLTDDVKVPKTGDLAKLTEEFLKEELRSSDDRKQEKQSTPELLEEAIKDEEIKTEDDVDEQENASVKVVGMEVTAHAADGGAWARTRAAPPVAPAAAAQAPPRLHEAEEVKSIYLETEIPQQSRVLVADFAEDRTDRPAPTKHSPMVVSGKMTLSLIQDAPRDTPERDPESTVDDFTTASAVTQNAAEKGEEPSDEEIEEEIEIEEIEEEVEEEEVEEEPRKDVKSGARKTD